MSKADKLVSKDIQEKGTDLRGELERLIHKYFKDKREVTMKYDENGMLIPQKISYNIKHDNEAKELIELTKIKRIIFFDIDGCICESFFPNIGEKADIDLLRKRILQTKLFPGFIKYFNIISNYPGIKIYFITGRRKKDFQDETITQLEPIKINEAQVIFFPEDYNHSKIRYNNFKIFNILSIAAKNRDSEMLVFDDLDGYFLRLSKIAWLLKIDNFTINLVKNPGPFWKLKLSEVKKCLTI
jgi:hypothetical protein